MPFARQNRAPSTSLQLNRAKSCPQPPPLVPTHRQLDSTYGATRVHMRQASTSRSFFRDDAMQPEARRSCATTITSFRPSRTQHNVHSRAKPQLEIRVWVKVFTREPIQRSVVSPFDGTPLDGYTYLNFSRKKKVLWKLFAYVNAKLLFTTNVPKMPSGFFAKIWAELKGCIEERQND